MSTTQAFSYLRCSTPEQKLGDSIRRQLAKSRALADRKGWHLNESLHLHDEGKSGYYGDNVTEGKLGGFIELTKSGQIPKGSVLIVESLDRLSREQLDDAYQLVRKILLLGINIATVTPEEYFTKSSLNDPMKLVVAIMIMSRAHEESAIKSERICQRWLEKRKKASEEKLTAMCPAWLELSEDRKHFILVAANVKAIKLIYRLYLNGLGSTTIARRLNTAKTPTLGRSKCWTTAAIKRLLQDKRVLGEYQPRRGIREGRAEAGPAIADYYPPIISKDDFRKVQQRKQTIPPGRMAKQTVYLFARLMKDIRDGSAIELMRRSTNCQHGGNPLLVPANTLVGVKPFVSFSYNAFEVSFLNAAGELTIDDVLPSAGKDKVQEQIADCELTINDCDRRVEKLRKRIKDDPNLDILADDVSELIRKRNEASEQRERLMSQAVNNVSEALYDTQALIDLLASTTGQELIDLRLRLRAKIAELIKEIWVAIVPENRTRRTLFASIFFRSGAFRGLSVTTERGKVVEVLTRKAKSPTFAKWILDRAGDKSLASLLPGLPKK